MTILSQTFCKLTRICDTRHIFVEYFAKFAIVTNFQRILSIAFVLALFLPFQVFGNTDSLPFVVVIDPGHGGKDVGCEGKRTNEKTIVLEVAKRFGRMINDSLPDVEVVFTRDDNRFIELNDRARIANRANGNVFISIHVNSIDRRNRNRANIHGASVYTLGLHKSDNNLAVAMRENSVMSLEDDFSEKYQGFDPGSSESYIIFELNQNQHLNKSIELADMIQQQLTTTAGRADKGVRQAGFWVLWATSMPSVLVELDYICNDEAERFMNSDKGKNLLAKSLFNAFQCYYNKHREENHAPRNEKPVEVHIEKTSTYAEVAPSTQDKNSKNLEGLTYHVQFLSATKVIPKGDHEIKGIRDVGYFKSSKYYKYYSGTFRNEKDAKKHLKKIKKRFPKAFIIKMRDGKPL